MVRFARVALVAVPMCHPHVIRSRKLMRHDEGNALKSQDNYEGLRALPLNPGESGKILKKAYPTQLGHTFTPLQHIPAVSLDVISLVASSCGYDRGHIEHRAAHACAVHLATQR